METADLCSTIPFAGVDPRCEAESSAPSGHGALSETGFEMESVDGTVRPVPGGDRAVALPGTVSELPTTMDLVRDVVAQQIDREQELKQSRKDFFGGVDAGFDGSPERLANGLSEMMALQTNFHEKSLGSALLLSTGKSSESFIKTLMRSQ